MVQKNKPTPKDNGKETHYKSISQKATPTSKPQSGGKSVQTNRGSRNPRKSPTNNPSNPNKGAVASAPLDNTDFSKSNHIIRGDFTLSPVGAPIAPIMNDDIDRDDYLSYHRTIVAMPNAVDLPVANRFARMKASDQQTFISRLRANSNDIAKIAELTFGDVYAEDLSDEEKKQIELLLLKICGGKVTNLSGKGITHSNPDGVPLSDTLRESTRIEVDGYVDGAYRIRYTFQPNREYVVYNGTVAGYYESGTYFQFVDPLVKQLFSRIGSDSTPNLRNVVLLDPGFFESNMSTYYLDELGNLTEQTGKSNFTREQLIGYISKILYPKVPENSEFGNSTLLALTNQLSGFSYPQLIAMLELWNRNIGGDAAFAVRPADGWLMHPNIQPLQYTDSVVEKFNELFLQREYWLDQIFKRLVDPETDKDLVRVDFRRIITEKFTNESIQSLYTQLYGNSVDGVDILSFVALLASLIDVAPGDEVLAGTIFALETSSTVVDTGVNLKEGDYLGAAVSIGTFGASTLFDRLETPIAGFQWAQFYGSMIDKLPNSDKHSVAIAIEASLIEVGYPAHLVLSPTQLDYYAKLGYDVLSIPVYVDQLGALRRSMEERIIELQRLKKELIPLSDHGISQFPLGYLDYEDEIADLKEQLILLEQTCVKLFGGGC